MSISGGGRPQDDLRSTPPGTARTVSPRPAAGEPSSSASSFHVTPPVITLPKGGGAISGLGEKFAANPVTGTGSLQIPIATTPGRGGFGPQLMLSYDSAAGNGPFGIGWRLSLPSITRRTDNGLPQYRDEDESDIFVVFGAEDLVPAFTGDDETRDADGNRVVDEITCDFEGTAYRVRRYRPRVEGAFALIERFTSQTDARDTFWRTISGDNVTTFYGRSDNSRIADPTNPARIFSWLVCETFDDRGNATVYEYAEENEVNVDRAAPNERNRVRTANRYVKRIRYGNTPSRLAADFAAAVVWHFEVQLDYGQEDYRTTLPAPDGVLVAFVRKPHPPAVNWPCRRDPFSAYRSGFEIRTYRLCRRILMFHRFDELLGNEPQLVSATEFAYAENAVATQLTSVTRAGYVAIGETPTERQYRRSCLPPLELTYSKAAIDVTVRDVDVESLDNLPTGLSDPSYQWVDLDNEGVNGILAEQGDAWFYKRNLSPINLEADPVGPPRARAKFAPLERIASRPNTTLAAAQFMDLAGDGHLDLVGLEGSSPGFYEHDGDRGWLPFRSFEAALNRRIGDPNLRLIDLDGDGRADVLITEDQVLTWHASLGEEGFASARTVTKPHDEESGPVLVFADGTQSIYLADMSGDGLTDLLRIRNGDICYWPNVGYGAFGAKVAMDSPPWFDALDTFDQQRIRLADIDGSGVTDIVYLHGDGPMIYSNQAGNRWSEGHAVVGLPRIDDHNSIVVADLLGNGTACLVWSSGRPGEARRPMKYVDLTGGQKPYLLVGATNNLGATTTIDYVPSTRFYLQDKLAGRPWITRLPFPVQCVANVTIVDRWRQTAFSTSYSYHHGYFDGTEREFRGFGRVEQIDRERYGRVTARNGASPWITDDLTLHQPPVKTITWYHTGAAIDRERILTQFEGEYFPRSVAARPARITLDQVFTEKRLAEPDLNALNLSSDEWREALRACKGMVLRQEVYELDLAASGEEPPRDVPIRLFSAATHNCGIRLVQRRSGNRHAVFLVTESEALACHYELDLRGTPPLKPDPRTTHTLNLSFDELGNVQQSVAVAYPRLRPFESPEFGEHVAVIRENQAERCVTYTETRYTTDAVDSLGGPSPVMQYRLRLPCEVQTYELTGLSPMAGSYFELGELRRLDLSARYPALAPTRPIARKAYHEIPQTSAPTMRLVEHTRTLFFDDDEQGAGAANRYLEEPLDLGVLGKLALVYQRYRLAMTRDLLDAVFTDGQLDDERPDGTSARDTLRDQTIGGYVSGTVFDAAPPPGADDEYWLCSGVAGFADDAREHFYLPEEYTDAFGNPTTAAYDAKYDLFVESMADALNNTTRVERFDYRVCMPVEQTDSSGNYGAVAVDALGMAIAVATMGKSRTESGDTVAGLQLDVPPADRERFFTRAYDAASPAQWIGDATSRFVYDLGEGVAANGTITYGHRPAAACGIVRETHVNAAVPGRLRIAIEYSDGLGSVLVRKTQAEADADAPAGAPALRWIASGKTVLNNKGTAVKQYEPYFSQTEHRFDLTEAEAAIGVTPLMYYDAVGRLVRTELPDGAVSRVEFSPWHVKTFDPNDTVDEARNAWLARRTGGNGSAEEQRAGRQARVHSDTPALAMLDTLGRDAVVIVHNRVEDANGTYSVDGTTYRNEYAATYTRHDCQGQTLWVRDARGNLVTQSLVPAKPDRDEPRVERDFTPGGNPNNDIGARVPAYDLAGSLLCQRSMDSGSRWMLTDAAGKAIFAWDVSDYRDAAGNLVQERRLFYTSYDELHRPDGIWLRVDGGALRMLERLEYQDGEPNDAANLNGQLVRHYDPSGRIDTVRRDFDGNVCEVARRLTNQPTESIVDWQATPENFLEAETFTRITEYDALARVTLQYNWHTGPGDRVSVYRPQYNARGLLISETLTVRARKSVAGVDLAADTEIHDAIEEIRYDVKGQKTLLARGNGTLTRCDYDPLTFRLRQLRTTLPDAGGEPAFPDAASNGLDARVRQQLHYVYDPSGNITEIYDEAQQPVFFQNQVVESRSRYEYDALYRLIRATGRENGALTGAPTLPEAAELRTRFPILDPNAQRNYTQTFGYDAAGNMLRMRHDAGAGTWTRRFRYADDSNRLAATWDTDDDWDDVDPTVVTSYDFDAHGNMLNVVKTASRFGLRWDHRDMLRQLDLGGGGMAYYQYDADKRRTRKRIERRTVTPAGDERWVLDWERIDLGGYERYRRYDGAGGVLEEIESHHLFDGPQRILLVDDVIETNRTHPDGTRFRRAPVVRYQYGNHLGSVCLALDHEADIISYEEFHPYGTPAFRAITQGGEAPPTRYRFTGMETDEESGLHYHHARLLMPWLARWANCDPIGVGDGLNVYLYASDRPTTHVDSSGSQGGSFTWGPMGQNMPDVDMMTRMQLIETARIRREAEIALEEHYAAGNINEQSEVKLKELQNAVDVLNATSTAQLALAGLGAARAVPVGPRPMPPPAVPPEPPATVSSRPPAPLAGTNQSTPPPAPAVSTQPKPLPPEMVSTQPKASAPVPLSSQPKMLPAGKIPKLLPAGNVSSQPVSVAPPKPVTPAQSTPPVPSKPPAVVIPPPPKAPPPPQFAVGRAGEKMAVHSIVNSPIGGPRQLAERQFTLKDASGKTARPDPNSAKGASKPDLPVKGEGNAVGLIEHKTPYNAPPEDPVDYVRLRPRVQAQMQNQRQILGQGNITWGEAGGPQTPVVQGEGAGVSTGYWSWQPPWDIQ